MRSPVSMTTTLDPLLRSIARRKCRLRGFPALLSHGEAIKRPRRRPGRRCGGRRICDGPDWCTGFCCQLAPCGWCREQRNGVRQPVRLTGRDPKGDGASESAGDHTSLGIIAATRSAKSFTIVSLSLRAPFRRAPAAFVCAHIGAVEERHSKLDPALLHQIQQTPWRAQRMKVWAALHQGPVQRT